MNLVSLGPSLTRQERYYLYFPLRDLLRGLSFSGVLYIVQVEQSGRMLKPDVYAVEEVELESTLEAGPWRFFAVCKCGLVPENEEGLYCVRVPRVKEDRARYGPAVCNCFGFNRWQNCKHADALTDLVLNHEEKTCLSFRV